MGYSSWDKNEYDLYSSSTVGKSTRQIFASSGMKDYLNPSGVLLRESRDSDAHPNSTAIIVGLDVTGSMGIIADKIAREGLGTLVNGILDQSIVPDPHIMIMGIGDVEYDNAPLQATQFESDIRIAQQLSDIFLEGGGGGNQTESYDLPWYFAAHRTSIDCFEKRGKKGYLFTIGDELPPKGVSKNGIKSTFGSDEQVGYTAEELLASAEEKYQVFHIIVEQGNYARRDLTNVTNKWRQLLSGRAILLSNYNYIAEVILAAIEVAEGADPQTVIDSTQDKSLKEVIKHALLD